MSYPIIIKKEITDFLEAQNFCKILSKLSNGITFPEKVEVWLKDSFFVTMETSLKSDIVTTLLCYKAGENKEDSFYFHDSTRASIGRFFAKVREYQGEEVSQFPVAVWKPYCKVFVTKDSYNKELEDAKNLLQELGKLDSSVRDKFCGVEEVLHTTLGESLRSEIPFQEGDLIQNKSGNLYRFCGDKNEVGAYLVYDSTMNRYLDCEVLKQYQKIEVFPALEETLKRFYAVFDPEFINKILKPATEVLGWEPTDSATIVHNCEPFSQWVEQKKRIFMKDERTFGFSFYFKVTNQLVVRGGGDSILWYLHLEAKNFDNDGGYSKEFFNPFLKEKSSFSRTVRQVLGMLSAIYETFSPEIREQKLTAAFIDIYSMWEQIQSTVKDLNEETNATLQKKVLELFGKEKKDSPAEEKVGSSGMQSLRAFDDDFGSSFQQKTETRIKMEDTMRSALAKMADGNPGAMVALSSLMKYSELLKPADPFMEILALDSLHLYGSKLYDFLIYCCENSIKNFRLVSSNHGYGNLSEKTIHEFVENCTPFFPNKDNNENLKNFKDWSAFKDCYPEGEDVPFDPNKKRHTWGNLDLDCFVTEVSKQGFKIGWQRNTREHQEIIMFRSDGLILHICAHDQDVKIASIYGEVPIAEDEKEAWGGSARDNIFEFTKNAKLGLKDFLVRVKDLTLYSVWPVKHGWLNLITPEEEQRLTDNGVINYRKRDDLIKQKLSECCDEMKPIIAKNLDEKSLFSESVLQQSQQPQTTASQSSDKTSLGTDATTKIAKKKIPTWSGFVADAFLLGFEVGWSKTLPKEPQEILLFRTDGLVLYACESAGHVTHAVVYGEIPFNEKDNIGKAGGAGTEGGKFSFVKNVRTGLKKLSNELESVELSAVWTVKHPGLFLLTPEEKKEFTIDEKTDMKQVETLTRQKLFECCDKMKLIIAKNLEAKSLFSK